MNLSVIGTKSVELVPDACLTKRDYLSCLITESGKLSRKYRKKKLLLYTIHLFDVILMYYFFDVIVTSVKRKIW